MTDYFTPTGSAGPAARQVAGSPPRAAVRATPTSRVARLLPGLVVAAVAVAVALGGWWWTGRPPAELRLPDSLAGLPVSPYDFGAQPGWAEESSDLAGLEAVGRGFGGDRGRRPLALNVVVMAGDGTGEIDLRMASGSPTRFGDVSCTQTLDVGAGLPTAGGGSGPQHSDAQALCWRTGRRLSVSVLVLGMEPDYLPTAARAVEEVWALQR